jgi:hypothetical protein
MGHERISAWRRAKDTLGVPFLGAFVLILIRLAGDANTVQRVTDPTADTTCASLYIDGGVA